MYKNMRSLVTAAVLSLAAQASHAAIVTTVTSFSTAPDVTGILFASSVANFTPEAGTATLGVPFAITGAPDHPPGNNSPNSPTIVDFGGTGSGIWSVDVGFNAAFEDGAGVDLKVYGTQLNTGENFNVLASADGITFSQLGLFDAPNRVGTFSVDVDFNGMLNVAGARFLRFTGTIDGFALGFDFDAVGVTHQATQAVPVPAAVWLFGSTLGALGVAARRRAQS